MASAYELAKEHIEHGLAIAAGQNIDPETYGQALIWQILQSYRARGRSVADIVSEVEFTLENIEEDGIFHVVRN